MGNTNKRIRTVVAVAVAGAGLFALSLGMADAKGGTSGGGGGGGGGGTTTGGAATGGTDTKQAILIPATCNGGEGIGYAGYNKSGSRATIAFGMGNDQLGADWTVTFDDNGEVFAVDSMPYPGTDWSIIENRDSAKGAHTITMVASNGTEECSISLNYRV